MLKKHPRGLKQQKSSLFVALALGAAWPPCAMAVPWIHPGTPSLGQLPILWLQLEVCAQWGIIFESLFSIRAVLKKQIPLFTPSESLWKHIMHWSLKLN